MDELLVLAVWICLGISTIVLLAMFVAGRGNVRHIKTSLMVSIMAHCGLALFSNEIVIPSTTVHAESSEQSFEINELAIESQDQQQLDSDQPTPIWDELAKAEASEIQRNVREELTNELPETTKEQPDEQDPEPVTPQDFPELENEPFAIPPAERSADQAPKTVEGTQLDEYEETVEARPEVEVPATRPGDRRRQSPGLTKSDVERETRQGRTDDPTTDLRESKRMEVADATTNPAAELKRGENLEAAKRRTGDAAETLPADNPGIKTANRKEELGKGVPQSRAFSRRDLTGATSSTQGLKDDVERNPRPRSDDPELGPRLNTRAGERQPPSDDTQLRLTRIITDKAGRERRAVKLPTTYQLRNLENRKKVAIRHGASKSSEEAVEKSLHWLASHQNVEGFWDADGFMSHCPAGVKACDGPAGRAQHQGKNKNRPKSGIQGDSGLTGLAVLTFLGAGYTHEEGKYADGVDRSLRWLIRQQTEDGFLGGKATRYAEMYCHGMASIALGEAYGMTQDPTLREPLQRAIDYIIARQNPKDGGWRYAPGQQGDMSMFGWQLMALKSAGTAGLEFPAKTRGLTIDFLVGLSLGENKGLAAYRSGEPITPAMTAEALFCKQVLGIKRANAQSSEAVAYLLKHLPKQSEQNLYYWYYGTLAMFQYGGKPWDQWNERVRNTLVASQRKEGHAAGSWDPRSPWGDYGGRIYSTVLSTLCLEVYYRFLPMYRVSEDEIIGERP